MAELGSLEVSLSLNAANFNGSIAQVNRQMTAMGSELRALQARGTEYSSSLTGLGQKQDILSRQFDASGVKLREQRQRYDELVASGTATEAQIERQANAVNRAQADYNRLGRELAEVTEQLRVQSSQWTQAGQRMQEAGAKLKSVGDGITSVGKDLSMKVTAPIAALGAASFKAAVDFESAFAGVRKTVDTTEEGFAKLEQGIRDMAKAGPSSATELASIMEMAGQLGVAEANLLSFTSVMSDLSTATNMTAEQAATEFARFANITGMAQTDFDKMGSSIVALGNNFATTESEISAMAMRLAGAGAQIGLSESDILGLSAALTSVGIEAEMGGSAISKVMVNMQVASSAGFKGVQELSEKTGMSLREMQLMASNNSKGFTKMAESLGMTKTELNNTIKAGANLEGFSKVAGMTGEQFVQAFEKDAIGALGAFINGLGNAESAGESAINMLQEMGITEVRLRDSLLRAGNANELFAEAINMSSEAWDENTALANEAAQRYATTASQLETLKNKVVDIGISLGEILIPMVLSLTEKIEPWIEKFSQLSTETQKNILLFGGLAAAIGPVLIVGGTLISTTGTILTAVGGLATAIGSAGGVVALLSAKLGFLTPILGALSGPVGWTALGIAAIGTAAVITTKEMSESSIQIQDWSDGVSKATADAVGAFVTISDEVGQSLSNLHITSTTITSDMATNLTGKFEAMYSQIVEAANTKHQEQMDSLSNYFLNSSALTSEEEAKILEKRQQAHETEIEILSAKNQIVADIMATAAEEKRALTDQEREVINNINQQMKEDAVRVLSENEVEQKVILEKMKADASEISALQAAEVVKNAVEQKEKVIEEANKQYEESIAHITRLRDETGDISAEQADRMIAEAKKSRDQTIYYAEEMHENIVSEAKAQAGEHVDQVEWETGEIKSKWEVMKQDVTKKMKETGASIKKDWSEAYANTKKSVSDIAESVNKKFSEFGESIGIKMNEAKDSIVKKWNEAEMFLKGINLVQIGKDIINGLTKGISDKFGDVRAKIEELASNLPQWARDMLGIKSPSRVFMEIGKFTGEGLAVGITSTEEANKKAIEGVTKVLSAAARNNAGEVAKIAADAEKKRTEIQADYAKKRAELDKKTASSSEAALKTTKDKKGKIVTTGTQKVQKIRADASAKLIKLNEDEQKKLTAVNTKAWADMQKKEAELSKARLESVKTYVADKKSLEELSFVAESEIWRKSIPLFVEGTKERVEAQKNYAKALETVNAEVTSVNEKYTKEMTRINSEFQAEEERLTKQYEQSLDTRTKALFNFVNLFDEFDLKTEESGQLLLDNLQSQVDGFKEWQVEIEKLSQKAIDDGLIKELTEMGPKALGKLRALNSLTETQLTQYSNLYKEKSELARTQAEKELVGMKADMESNVGKLREAANEELSKLATEWVSEIKAITGGTALELKSLESIGKDAVRGLISGMDSMHKDLQETAKKLGDTISKATADALKVKSPSRVMMEIGAFAGEGLAIGIERSGKGVIKASENVVEDVKKTFEELPSTINGFAKESFRDIQNIRDAYADLYKTGDAYGVDLLKFLRTASTMGHLTESDVREINEKIEHETELAQFRLVDMQKNYNDNVVRIENERVSKQLEAVKRYEDEVTKRTEEIAKQFGLLENVNIKEISTDELTDSLESQINSMELYIQSMDKLSTRGLNNELLEEIGALGPKMAGEVAAFADMSEQELNRYIELWNKKNEIARQTAESELTAMRLAMEAELKQIDADAEKELDKYKQNYEYLYNEIHGITDREMKELKRDMVRDGADAMKGLINGMESMKSAVVSTAQSIADAVSSTIQGALDIHSPSRIMRGFGVNIGEGLIVGMDEMINKVALSSKRLANVVQTAQISEINGRLNTPSTTTVDSSRTFAPVINNYGSSSNSIKEQERMLRRLAFKFN